MFSAALQELCQSLTERLYYKLGYSDEETKDAFELHYRECRFHCRPMLRTISVQLNLESSYIDLKKIIIGQCVLQCL